MKNIEINYTFRYPYIKMGGGLTENDKIVNIITNVNKYIKSLNVSNQTQIKSLEKVKNKHYSKNEQDHYQSSDNFVQDLISADSNIIELFKKDILLVHVKGIIYITEQERNNHTNETIYEAGIYKTTITLPTEHINITSNIAFNTPQPKKLDNKDILSYTMGGFSLSPQSHQIPSKLSKNTSEAFTLGAKPQQVSKFSASNTLVQSESISIAKTPEPKKSPEIAISEKFTLEGQPQLSKFSANNALVQSESISITKAPGPKSPSETAVNEKFPLEEQPQLSKFLANVNNNNHVNDSDLSDILSSSSFYLDYNDKSKNIDSKPKVTEKFNKSIPHDESSQYIRLQDDTILKETSKNSGVLKHHSVQSGEDDESDIEVIEEDPDIYNVNPQELNHYPHAQHDLKLAENDKSIIGEGYEIINV